MLGLKRRNGKSWRWPRHKRKAKLTMKGESSRQDTCIMERENDAKLSESIWKASNHQSRCSNRTWSETLQYVDLDLRRGKTLNEEELQQYCFQCKWFMMSCLHGEAERSRGWQQMIKGGALAKLLPKWVKHIWQSISAWQRFLASWLPLVKIL